ncbi:helix-hairpin-helix domain-containing protein [Streptomyces sp. NPDC093089]|uniref:helix-hairpin-helix domain-containing protein n=1 Tax=Streptomyces sp. NPDC093089 TaxID=3366024 RepID=UPI00381BBEAB
MFPAVAPPVEPETGESPPEVREEPAAPERGSPPGLRARLAVAVRERTPVRVQTRCGLEPRTLAALTVLLVVAAGLAGAHFWTGRPEPVGAPELVRAAREATATAPEARGVAGVPGLRTGPGVGAGMGAGDGVGPGPGPGPGPGLGSQGASAASGASGDSGAKVVVDVGGKVLRPGVLTLPAGSRVADALRAAGGARPGADLTGLNRARVLSDGEQVLVGLPGMPSGGVGAGAGSAGGGAPGVPLSLNTATVEQLDALPGVGPVLARHIVDHRVEHGGFRSVTELREVNGIGERRFADLEPLVRL